MDGNQSMEYRVEKKYLCSDYELAIIRHRINGLLSTDGNQSGDCYSVRSVYFDTVSDDCFYANAAGEDSRTKYRIRIYNHSDKQIRYEMKHKQNGYIKKESFAMERSECEELLAGGYLKIEKRDNFPRNRVFMQQKSNRLQPVIIVEYERSAYVCPIGNVRITIDRNIAVSKDVCDFFEEELSLIPLLQPHMHLLEVKYDELLPDYIAQALDIGNLQQIAFSKYYLARQITDLNETLIF